MKSKIFKFVALIALLTAGGLLAVKCSKESTQKDSGCEIYGARLKVKPQYAATENYSIIEDPQIKALLTKHGLRMHQITDHEDFPELTLKYNLTPEFRENRECYVHEFLSTGKFEDEVNIFSPVFPDKDGACKIQCFYTGAVDPQIVSIALPGIVYIQCIEILPYPNYGGYPEAWSPHAWLILLVMAEGTDHTKLAPIITLAPGATITDIYQSHGGPEFSHEQVDYTGIAEIGVYDFTKQVSLILTASNGSKVDYLVHAVPLNHSDL